VIKDYRLSRSQRQAQHTDAQPPDVQNSKPWVQCDSEVSIENRAVENEDNGEDLATKVCNVADHEKSIRFLDWAADGLVTPTKLTEVAAELASIADTFTELLVQLLELII